MVLTKCEKPRGIIKQITGNDLVSGRALYKDQETFLPQFALFMWVEYSGRRIDWHVLTELNRLTNDVPRFSDNSEGTWRRVKFLEMCTRFVAPGQLQHDYERPIDPTLDKKMKRWPPAFLWILVELFKQHKGAPLEDCPSVVQSNLELRRESDHVALFIERHFGSAPDYLLSLDEAMDTYNDFCASEGTKHLRPHAVKRRLRGAFGEPRIREEKYYFKAALKMTVAQFAARKRDHS